MHRLKVGEDVALCVFIAVPLAQCMAAHMGIAANPRACAKIIIQRPSPLPPYSQIPFDHGVELSDPAQGIYHVNKTVSA